jgi:hypothetical protein
MKGRDKEREERKREYSDPLIICIEGAAVKGASRLV